MSAISDLICFMLVNAFFKAIFVGLHLIWTKIDYDFIEISLLWLITIYWSFSNLSWFPFILD
jgi:hypothetical protein